MHEILNFNATKKNENLKRKKQNMQYFWKFYAVFQMT